MSVHAAVLGGGITGLATALALTGRGVRVTLFEGDGDLGGLGTTFAWRDTHLEKFYHCILPDDAALLPRIAELGLSDQLLWRETAMGFMYQGRIWPMNTPMDLLRFGPLSPWERVRMGLLGLRARHAGLAPALDDITAEDWVRGLVGDRCFEVLWKPLLSAKIGDHYRALPALWLSSRMNREKASGPERKGCLTGGYRALIDAFAATLRARGAGIRLRAKVEGLAETSDGMTVALADGVRERFDLVVSTLPLVTFQRITRELALPPGLRDLTLDYQGVVSSVFLTEQPLTHYYWMPWVDSGVRAQGVIEMSNLVPRSRTHGLHVNYLVNYTHRDTPLFQLDDDALLAVHAADLARLFPAAAATVRERFVFRAPFVEPIWTTGYSRLLPPHRVRPGRLYLAGTSQVYPRVNSWNSCCAVVDQMLPEIEADLAAAGARAVA
jgi:protoporphyrinogen oxidase